MECAKTMMEDTHDTSVIALRLCSMIFGNIVLFQLLVKPGF